MRGHNPDESMRPKSTAPLADAHAVCGAHSVVCGLHGNLFKSRAAKEPIRTMPNFSQLDIPVLYTIHSSYYKLCGSGHDLVRMLRAY